MEPSEIPLADFLEKLRIAEAANDRSEIEKLMNDFIFTDHFAIKKSASRPASPRSGNGPRPVSACVTKNSIRTCSEDRKSNVVMNAILRHPGH
jgi:hypothetical protein